MLPYFRIEYAHEVLRAITSSWDKLDNASGMAASDTELRQARLSLRAQGKAPPVAPSREV
jgi:hypothetical protein